MVQILYYALYINVEFLLFDINHKNLNLHSRQTHQGLNNIRLLNIRVSTGSFLVKFCLGSSIFEQIFQSQAKMHK